MHKYLSQVSAHRHSAKDTSMDAGGLAQMTYQSPFNNTNIGVSGPGFASRGKGNHIKRLSFAPPSKTSPIDETQQTNTVSTPRTSRGHLLAGLRTAPKTAALSNVNTGFGLENSKYANSQYSGRVPQTAIVPSFSHKQSMGVNGAQSMYRGPEQVLAPPELDFEGEDHVDQHLYNELVATNAYLAQQQRVLQQQLANVTAAAHQMNGLNLSSGSAGVGLDHYQQLVGSSAGLYSQQFQQGVQPLVQPVPGTPGLYSVFNPLTGQSSFFVDHTQAQGASSPPNYNSVQSPGQTVSNVPRQFSPQRDVASPFSHDRSVSPPKQSVSPPQDVEPLPPPSANAFRRGHKKGLSSLGNVKTNGDWTRSGPPSGALKTPMTGTFGPGHGRAGEHPVRQPRGPPLLQELEEKPTAKHEGSKNFATRQRRRAIHDLVKAGRERRSESRQAGSGSGTPASESEFTFSISPSEDGGLASRSNISRKPSIGSIHGAIGSERKEKSHERGSLDSSGGYSAKSLSSDDGNSVGGSMVEVDTTRHHAPAFLLSSAEKRRTVAV